MRTRREHRAPSLAAIVGILALVYALGCASGTVTTAYGPRPAAEVQAQDTVADILQSLDAGYTEAVRIHDAPATVDKETREVHAAHRATLIAQHDALAASWNVLLGWKQAAGSAYTPASVIQPLVASLPSFLDLAVSSGAMTREKADKVLTFVRALFPTFAAGGTP